MRLIDADKLLKLIEDFGEGQGRLDLIDPAFIRNAPTVEAIPKADYEARLRVDMVDMLTELQLEIESYHLDIKSTEFDDGYNMGLGCAFRKIQERINALKESANAKDNN